MGDTYLKDSDSILGSILGSLSVMKETTVWVYDEKEFRGGFGLMVVRFR